MKPQELARFEKLLAEALPAAQRAARLLTDDEDAAEDLLAEAVMRALFGFKTLRDELSFQAWLLRIIANCCQTAQRKRKLRQTVELDGASLEGNAGAPLSHNEWLRAALAVLLPNEKEAVILHYLEGYPESDAARAIGISKGAFNMRLARARLRIAKLVTWRPSDG